MSNPQVVPIKSTTQNHLPVEDIQEDLVLLKDGSAAMVLELSAVNFGLLSEREQDATIYAYAGILNSLSFPIQIVILSKKKDVSNYLESLKKQEDKQAKPALKAQTAKYRKFVERLVKENNVLDKKFYLIIPFSHLELGVGSALAGSMKKSGKLPADKEYIFSKAKTTLTPKRDHVIRQFGRLGLKIKQLDSHQLIRLFYRLYNPEDVGIRHIIDPKAYKSPIVQAAVK